MTILRIAGVACCTLALAGPALAGGQLSAGQLSSTLQQQYPGVHYYYGDDGRIGRVFGMSFSFGDSAEASADAFISEYAGVFGLTAGQLQRVPADNGAAVQPVSYEPASETYRFFLVRYEQVADGLAVLGGELRALVRNEPGYPLVWAGSTLRPVGDLDTSRAGTIDTDLGVQTVMEAYPALVQFSEPEVVVWAGDLDVAAPATLATVFVGDNGLPATGEYQKLRFVADAASGAILHSESLILHADVAGNVSGRATQGSGADFCGPEEPVAMKYARVAVGTNAAFADENGDYVITGVTGDPVTVTAQVRGEWFRVNNEAGAETTLTQDVSPPGPADFMFNDANDNEFRRAEVNGYVEANVARDMVLRANPSYPTIATQTDFPVNVNINASCNAYYDGGSINFYRQAGGCGNTAYSVVVHHEYGHHVVDRGGSGQGAYGEGLGDVMGVIITEDPITGRGFYLNECDSGIRSADNNLTYPCFGEIHYCGQLLSGCVYETMLELQVTEPADYLDIIQSLAVNSVLLHTGSDVAPDIYIDYLTLDDDDADLSNGTPHMAEITAGFDLHNMTTNLPEPIECADIANMVSGCTPNGTLIVVVVLTSAAHDGQAVEVTVNGTAHSVTVNRRLAVLRLGGQSGAQTIELTSPVDCRAPIAAQCP